MLVALLASAIAQLVPLPEPLAGEIRGAIWFDLERNALIGSFSWLAADWYNAAADSPSEPDLHLDNLSCTPRDKGMRCTFSLYRDGGSAIVRGAAVPADLSCSALFVQAAEGKGWVVRHLPPPHGGGHRRTSLQCSARPAASVQ